jgi:transposase-like protein
MRRRWSDEERLQALALGREHGAPAAALTTGIPAGTIRGWLSRSGPATEAEAAVATAITTGRLTDDELGALQRSTMHEYRAALVAGNHLGAQRLAIAIGVLDTKLAERAKAGTDVRPEATRLRLTSLREAGERAADR